MPSPRVVVSDNFAIWLRYFIGRMDAVLQGTCSKLTQLLSELNRKESNGVPGALERE